MENNERILIAELRDDMEIDPKKYLPSLLIELESRRYIKLLLDMDKEVIDISRGDRFAVALEIYLKK